MRDANPSIHPLIQPYIHPFIYPFIHRSARFVYRTSQSSQATDECSQEECLPFLFDEEPIAQEGIKSPVTKNHPKNYSPPKPTTPSPGISLSSSPLGAKSSREVKCPTQHSPGKLASKGNRRTLAIDPAK